MKQKIIFLLILLFAISTSCHASESNDVSMLPPINFHESDLIGVWEASNTQYSLEKLEIREDNTFSQTFKLLDIDYEFQIDGTWVMIREETKCAYIHLDGMRFFDQVFEIAENGNVWPGGTPAIYWNSCGDRAVYMVGKTILSVGSHPDSSNGIVLWHMSSQKEAINTVFVYRGNEIP